MTIQLPVRKNRHGLPVHNETSAAGVVSGGEPIRAAGEPPRFEQAVEAAQRADRSSASSLTLRVGDLAKRTGKTVRALHLYEEHGLLAPAQRSSGGYRLYTRDSEVRVRWIDKLQQMGFSLTDIKQIVQDVERSRNAPDAMQRVHDLFREKLEDTREQLRRLSALEGELENSLTYLATCDSCETEELLGACSACARHKCDHKTPELVLGFRVH